MGLLKILSEPKKGVRSFNKVNTFMEALVELPNGQRVYMSKKEIEQFKNDSNVIQQQRGH